MSCNAAIVAMPHPAQLRQEYDKPTIELRKKSMPHSNVYTLILIAIAVVVGVALVSVNTLGVEYLNESDVHMPNIALAVQATQPSPVPTMQAPPQSPPDNTALWIALISSLVLNFFSFISGMFNTWLQYKLKIATNTMKDSLEENTNITRQTKTAVNGQFDTIGKLEADLADRSNHK